MRHDEAGGNLWNCGDDHTAGAGDGVAIPHCGHIRTNLACACGNRPSISYRLVEAQPRDASGLKSALHGWPRRFWVLYFSCQQICDR